MANSRNQTQSKYDPGLMLYSIASLSSWSSEGVSFSSLYGGGKTPDGIMEIRAERSPSIEKMHDIVAKHSNKNKRRSKKTDAFYQLIRNVHNYREDGPKDQQEQIDEFCFKHLDDADRRRLPGGAKVESVHPVLAVLRSFI